MSILKYFSAVKKSKGDDKLDSSSTTLPDPHGPLSEKVPTEVIASANAAVAKVITKGEASRTKKQKGPYLYLTDVQRYEVGKRAAECGTTTTIRYYKTKFLTEPTVRRLKAEYQEFVKGLPKGEKSEVKEMPCKKKQGRPLLLGNELDRQVQDYIKYLRERGTAINTSVVMASAEGIVKSKDANLLKENGNFGGIEITKSWAHVLLGRMGMVKRKACSKNKVAPEHFDSVKEQFFLAT